MEHIGQSILGLSFLRVKLTQRTGRILVFSNATICGVNAHGFQNIAFGDGNHIVVQSNYFHVNLRAPGTSNGALEIWGGNRY